MWTVHLPRLVAASITCERCSVVDRSGLRFVVPLRADTGWADRFVADVADLDNLVELPHVSQREKRLPASSKPTHAEHSDPTPHYPACSAKAAPPNPPAATSSPH